jgi:hypothetical protein
MPWAYQSGTFSRKLVILRCGRVYALLGEFQIHFHPLPVGECLALARPLTPQAKVVGCFPLGRAPAEGVWG